MALKYFINVTDKNSKPYQNLLSILNSYTELEKLKHPFLWNLEKLMNSENGMVELTIPELKALAEIMVLFKNINMETALNQLATQLCDETDWNSLMMKHVNDFVEFIQNLQDYQKPDFNADYPLEQVVSLKLENKLPKDVFNCVLDSRLCEAVLKFTVETGYPDYRLPLVFDKKLCDDVAELSKLSD